MSDFECHAFCTSCGAHRGRAAFGTPSKFFNDNDGPCRKCGAGSPGWDGHFVCKRVGPPWRRRWVDANGDEINPARPDGSAEA